MVVALALLVATAAWWLGSGRWTAMPSVVGLPESTAQQLVVEADLRVASAPGGDGRAAAGTVTGTDQPAGARLPRGTLVTLTVSTGRPTVPAIPAGTSREEAEKLVTAAGLDPDVDRDDAEYSGSVPPGRVLRTEPGAGTALARGATVQLVLSRGPERRSEQIEVPSVIGDDFDDAADELSERGLEVERKSQSGLNDRLRDRLGDRFGNEVLQQSHGPGSLVDEGTTITLTTL